MEDTESLDPGNHHEYSGTPYPVSAKNNKCFPNYGTDCDFLQMGLDPVWQLAVNKIEFLNSYKMKISIILGLFHMMFGLMLSLANKVIKKSYSDIYLEFIPQLVFLVSIFFYLVFMIFYKWTLYYADNEQVLIRFHIFKLIKLYKLVFTLVFRSTTSTLSTARPTF